MNLQLLYHLLGNEKTLKLDKETIENLNFRIENDFEFMYTILNPKLYGENNYAFINDNIINNVGEVNLLKVVDSSLIGKKNNYKNINKALILIENIVRNGIEEKNNYEIVKRQVPSREEFFDELTREVECNCKNIMIATPKSELEKELKENKCKIMMESAKNEMQKNVISYPNEKTLLYGISKAAIQPLKSTYSIEEQAIITAVNIGKCISKSEVIRDFNGWTWSIEGHEIESTECNIIYIFLSYLLGYEFVDNITVEEIKNNVSSEFFEELKRVAVQFYMSYDKTKNEEILKKLSDDKKLFEKMKHQSEYVIEIAENKRNLLTQIKRIDETLSNQQLLKKEYMEYNSKLPDEKKVFSVSHYEELVQKQRVGILNEIEKLNRMLNPNEYVKEKDRLQYEIKFYEEKTDISKLQKEFIKMFEKKIENVTDKREMLDIIYELRYLNYVPNCKMNLYELEEKAIPKAIKCHVIAPVYNNDSLDYRLLRGIFTSQVVSLENLYIKLSAEENRINVELFDTDMLEKRYNVILPEGSNIEIRKSKRTRIFERL